MNKSKYSKLVIMDKQQQIYSWKEL
jgi:hypothetical protein